jgi:hypothetical protein
MKWFKQDRAWYVDSLSEWRAGSPKRRWPRSISISTSGYGPAGEVGAAGGHGRLHRRLSGVVRLVEHDGNEKGADGSLGLPVGLGTGRSNTSGLRPARPASTRSTAWFHAVRICVAARAVTMTPAEGNQMVRLASRRRTFFASGWLKRHTPLAHRRVASPGSDGCQEFSRHVVRFASFARYLRCVQQPNLLSSQGAGGLLPSSSNAHAPQVHQVVATAQPNRPLLVPPLRAMSRLAEPVRLRSTLQ